VEVLHGDIPQNQREVTLKGFKDGKFRVLVATDVASRGLDIPNVDLVVQCEPPKDVETYIHRSGRTARAGNEGTCITFYTRKQKPLIQQIEKKAGIIFAKIGAPLPEDIIKASSRDVVKSLEKVSPEVLPFFDETAQELIRCHGADKALTMALAYISGHLSKIQNRSLLTGQEGYITYELLSTDQPFRGIGPIWTIIRRIAPPEMVEAIRGMRTFKNSMGAVFDIPEISS